MRCSSACRLALTRPAYAYLFWFLFAGAVLLILFGRTRQRFATVLVVFLAAYGATTLPWIMRNAVKFGDASITHYYGPRVLCHRLAYNGMTWPEWRAAVVFWFPRYGETWSARLFPKSQYEKLLSVCAPTWSFAAMHIGTIHLSIWMAARKY